MSSVFSYAGTSLLLGNLFHPNKCTAHTQSGANEAVLIFYCAHISRSFKVLMQGWEINFPMGLQEELGGPPQCGFYHPYSF